MNTPEFFPTPRSWRPASGTPASVNLKNMEAFSRFAEPDTALHPQGYRIDWNADGLRVKLGSKEALRYAWQHFQQWTQMEPAPCGVLEDAPALERRGFMLDISRCKVPTRESLSEWVRLLAAFRYNEFQLYTEHTFAYREHRSVWENASPLNEDDIRWLQELCRNHGIELVPNQNCFGHFERWIRHPDYRHYAESPDGFLTPWGEKRREGSVLKPDADSLALVTGLLDELLPLFDSAWVNIGCDETFELGQGFSKARCEREGTGKVYSDFVRQIMTHVADNHGKRCQFWGDILLKTPEQLKNLPPDALALEWGYEADHPFVKDSRCFSESGMEFMICPGTSSWATFAGRTENMLENIRRAAAAAVENGAKGILLTDWGDKGHLQQSPVSYPALAWCALQSWNPGTATPDVLTKWCDTEAFGGSDGDTDCWLRAGRVHECLRTKIGNMSAIFRLFEKPETALEIPVEHIRETWRELDNLSSPLARREEWNQTVRNMRLALGTALKLHGEAPPDLKGRLRETRESQRTLWLQRNREGGLAESLRMYTAVSAKLNDGETDD